MVRIFLTLLLVTGCHRQLHITPGDPKLGIPMDYEIATTYNQCDGLGNGCVLVTDVVKR